MRNDRRPFVYLLAAIVGVFVAHVGDYVAVFPHAHARNAALAATGHSYWPAATILAAVAASALLAGVVSSGVRRGRSGTRPLRMAVGPLALFQVVLFFGIEVVERVPPGLDVGSSLRSPEFVIGVLSQFLVAALVCRFTRTVERVAAKAASRHGRAASVRATSQEFAPLQGWTRVAREGVSPLGSRAPPFLLLALNRTSQRCRTGLAASCHSQERVKACETSRHRWRARRCVRCAAGHSRCCPWRRRFGCHQLPKHRDRQPARRAALDGHRR